MMNPGSLKITTPSDREIAMTRVFDAPRRLVYDAYTKPELPTRRLGVHKGWVFAVCEMNLKGGGTYQNLRRNLKGVEMGMGGVYQEVVPLERIVATEHFDQSWYEGYAIGTVTFDERDG